MEVFMARFLLVVRTSGVSEVIMRHAQMNNRGWLGDVLKAMVWEINRSLTSHNPKALYVATLKWEALLREYRSSCNGNGGKGR